MEPAPFPRALAAPPPDAITAKPPLAIPVAPPRPPEVIAAWPRSAQLAAAALFGGLITLLAVHALSFLRGGATPSQLDDARTISYRVDLNEARRAELLQLPGIGAGLADKIDDYRRANGGFRSVDELLQVKGIGPTTLERLRPFVTVKTGAKAPPYKGSSAEAAFKPSKVGGKKEPNADDPIDINQASVAELQRLPGIGPVLSQRIVDERDLKAFAAVAELRRVKGIGPKTLEKIAPFVTVAQPTAEMGKSK